MLTTASINKPACSPKALGSRDSFYYGMTNKPDLSVPIAIVASDTAQPKGYIGAY